MRASWWPAPFFVRCCGERTEEGDAAIVEAVTALCRRLDMTYSAEGMETEGQLYLLARGGCTEAQGYLLGRPVPQAALLRSLDASG
ncbi:EAL domain-containing protein [Falsiroseomonas sp. E2-1-a4]|uniref:EAL domain-containing protein n=1 Tax=Falsiroseomonas sp. E2-1-a4 TaxID=3239299 RepID=UPI003F2FBB03